jgi:hypothetical protein
VEVSRSRCYSRQQIATHNNASEHRCHTADGRSIPGKLQIKSVQQRPSDVICGDPPHATLFRGVARIRPGHRGQSRELEPEPADQRRHGRRTGDRGAAHACPGEQVVQRNAAVRYSGMM